MVKIWAAKLGRLRAVCAQTDGLLSLLVTGRAELNLWGLGTPAAEGCIASSCPSLLSPWTCDPSSGYSFKFSEAHCMHIYGHGLVLSPASWTGNGTVFIETFSCKMSLESLFFPLECDLYSNCKSLFRNDPSCWLQVLCRQRPISKCDSITGNTYACVVFSTILPSALTRDYEHSCVWTLHHHL